MMKRPPGRPAIDTKKKKVLVATRVDPDTEQRIVALQQLWKDDQAGAIRKIILAGLDAIMETKPSSTRMALLSDQLDRLSGENRLKAEVLLKLLEREVFELLTAQSTSG